MNEKRLWKLFLLPSLGGVLVFYLLPFVLSLYYGMIDNMGSRQFVGLQNVVETLTNPMFLQAAGNTAVYLGLSIPLILLLSLGLALLLHRSNSALLFALLVPLVLPSGVTAFFWNAIFSAGGLVNKILYLLGQPLINWKTSAVAIVIPVMLFLWKNTGLITAIMLIGYSRIPREYYEIAAGEGATPWVCFYKVTLPYLAPTLFLSGLIAVIQSFKVFRELYILFGAYPNPHLYLLQHYMNNQFSSLNLQKLSAASHILFVLMAAVILLTYFLQKRLSDRFTSVELSPTKVLVAGKKTGRLAGKLVLWVAVVAALFPLLFTVTNSFLSPQEVVNRYSSQVLPGNAGSLARDGLHFVQMTLLPTEPTLAQYREFLLQSPEQLRLFWNSVLLIVPILLGQLVVSVLAAYAFERSRWKYKEVVFAVYLVILLMPMQVTLVPNYITADLLGLLNSYWAIILPAMFHPLGVFLLRLQMKGFDRSWVEAAQDCGASEWQIFRRVILPNLRPGIMIVLVLTVAEYWNIIDQAIVFLDTTVKQPLSVSLSQMLAGESGIFFAASCVYVLPVLLVFGMGKSSGMCELQGQHLAKPDAGWYHNRKQTRQPR